MLEMTDKTVQSSDVVSLTDGSPVAHPPALTTPREIPLSRLVVSNANVRRIRSGISLDELAEDIARRGLLQSLSVRPVHGETGADTGEFAVSAGGRRLQALQKLASDGRISGDSLIPCLLRDDGIEIEDSLAENVMREALHPLDQFRAFKALSEEENLTNDEIAARFFVSPHIVRQRLRLAAASPKLLEAYEADKLTLDQLMAFCVTGDHSRQDAVFEQIRQGFNSEPYHIRRLLTEGAVKGNDRRVLFVGSEAYEAAGGVILRDLFSGDGGGWYQDVTLLDRLAHEKLGEEAKAIMIDDWKWVETAIQFPYGYLNGLSRLTSRAAPVTQEDQARYDAALAEYNALSEEYAGVEELPEEVDHRLGELETIMAALDECLETFNPGETAYAGVFVSIEHDGRLRVESGYIRAGDRAAFASRQEACNLIGSDATTASFGQNNAIAATSPVENEDEIDTDTAPRLSDRLIAELTAHRTLALREAVTESPDTALLAMTHALVLKTFYRMAGSDTCLEIEMRSASLNSHAPEIGETNLAKRMDERQTRWATMLPTNPIDLWNALVGFDPDSLAGLFAFCAASSLNAVEMPHIRRTRELAHASALAMQVNLDMRRHWTATAKSFFGKITKAQILATVREVKGEAHTQMIEHLKKADMAVEAERLVSGSNWLPEPLKAPDDIAPLHMGPIVDTAPTREADQELVVTDEEEKSFDEVALPAFLTEALAQSAAHAVAAE